MFGDLEEEKQQVFKQVFTASIFLLLFQQQVDKQVVFWLLLNKYLLTSLRGEVDYNVMKKNR